MTRDEFLAAMERELTRLKVSDRVEAMEYYIEYFEEAGPGNEQKVIAELGSPEKIAAQIRAQTTLKDAQKDPDGFTVGTEPCGSVFFVDSGCHAAVRPVFPDGGLVWAGRDVFYTDIGAVPFLPEGAVLPAGTDYTEKSPGGSGKSRQPGQKLRREKNEKNNLDLSCIALYLFRRLRPDGGLYCHGRPDPDHLDDNRAEGGATACRLPSPIGLTGFSGNPVWKAG